MQEEPAGTLLSRGHYGSMGWKTTRGPAGSEDRTRWFLSAVKDQELKLLMNTPRYYRGSDFRVEMKAVQGRPTTRMPWAWPVNLLDDKSGLGERLDWKCLDVKCTLREMNRRAPQVRSMVHGPLWTDWRGSELMDRSGAEADGREEKARSTLARRILAMSESLLQMRRMISDVSSSLPLMRISSDLR